MERKGRWHTIAQLRKLVQPFGEVSSRNVCLSFGYHLRVGPGGGEATSLRQDSGKYMESNWI